MVGRRELDIELELFLQPRNRAEDRILLGDDPDVHVDRAGAPAVENGRYAAREIDAAVDRRGLADGPHELADPIGVG